MKRFTRTANNLRTLVSDARHAKDEWDAPKTPMNLDEAMLLFSQLLRAWLATK